jgi:hypothetical protein
VIHPLKIHLRCAESECTPGPNFRGTYGLFPTKTSSPPTNFLPTHTARLNQKWHRATPPLLRQSTFHRERRHPTKTPLFLESLPAVPALSVPSLKDFWNKICVLSPPPSPQALVRALFLHLLLHSQHPTRRRSNGRIRPVQRRR